MILTQVTLTPPKVQQKIGKKASKKWHFDIFFAHSIFMVDSLLEGNDTFYAKKALILSQNDTKNEQRNN